MSLEIRNLEINPPSPERTSPILEAPVLELEAGSLYQLSGPSGTGKSLFLKALAGLIPFDGVIRFKGMEKDQFTQSWWRSMISYVPPVPALFPGNIRDNLMIPFRFQSQTSLAKPDEEDLREMLDRIGLKKWDLSSSASKLSHGEKMRVQLLRHLVVGPEWILLDETMANLDVENISRVHSLLRWEMENRQLGVIAAQHTPLENPSHLLCVMNGKIHGPLSPN